MNLFNVFWNEPIAYYVNHKYQQPVADTSQNIGGAVEMSVNKSYLVHISLVNPIHWQYALLYITLSNASKFYSFTC
jgi:hypothetical protein